MQVNKINIVSSKTILSWYPGDFYFDKSKCGCGEYHKCVKKEYQWQDVLESARIDDRYPDIYKAIRTKGFILPLAAKITEDDHVVLLDGHHRLAVSLDLSLKEIPVHLGDKNSDIMHLRSMDSGWWRETHDPFVTQLGM